MGTNGKKHRVYWRHQGGQERAYGDFRDFADVGGKREALIPPGATRATTDPDVARKLASDRVAELEAKRRGRVLLGEEQERKGAKLKPFAAHHLREKKRAGKVTDATIEGDENYLSAAVEFFGAGRDLRAIHPSDVSGWANKLRRESNGRGGTLSDATVRKYLNSVSNLYRRAQADGKVEPGFNPVQAMMDKPSGSRKREAEFLEVHDAALYLEAARLYDPEDDRARIPFAHPLVATFLLTGGRKAGVLGLTKGDVNFEREVVRFRPNKQRRLKSSNATRSVPLWPQLASILKPHVEELSGGSKALLFPSPRTGRMLTDVRKLLDSIGELAGFDAGDVRTRIFRHTYCAARLQTLDHGEPVSEYTVARELGHGGDSLVKRVYGHLGTIRHRSEQVEYRVGQHEKRLGKRLKKLRARTNGKGA